MPPQATAAAAVASAAAVEPSNAGTTAGSASVPATTAGLTTATTASSVAVPTPPEETSGDTAAAPSSTSVPDAITDVGSSLAPSRARTQPSTMASSTSINNLALTAPVTEGTPLTGAGKMAAAAASLKRGAGSDEIRRELQYNDEEHPLSDKVLASRCVDTQLCIWTR